MQSDWKKVYKLTAERTGEKEQTYKDIGNFVFHTLYKKIRRPQTLIIKLRGVGSWYLRRMRMRGIVEIFPPNFELTREDFDTPYGFLKQENKVEIYHIFKERLKDYDKYIEIRDEIRKKRYETQHLLSPKGGETSQDNLG